MAKLVLADLGSLQNETSAVNTINANHDHTETALENTVSRDGSSPNAMLSNFDMNGHRILNLPLPSATTEPLRLGDVNVVQLEADVAAAAVSATAAATSATSAASSLAAIGSSVTTAAASATAAASSATSASSSASTATTQATNAATSATTATTQASNAATSASSASTSATNAATSETNASTSATSAASSATTASTQATNASTSATNAAASAAQLTGTSATSITIATGSKSFTTQSGKFFTTGIWLLITSNADTTNYMHGQSTSYSGTSLTVNVADIGGSGAHTDWTITVAGTRGATGAAGSLDFTGLVDTTSATGDYIAFGDVSDSTNTKRTTVALLKSDNLLVGGPASSTDTAIAKFNGTGGLTIQNSGVLIDASNNVSAIAKLTNTAGRVLSARVHIAAGAVTVATTDYVVVVNKTSGAATAVNLPSSPVTGAIHWIKDGKGDSATNNITLTPAAGNIDGASTQIMAVNYQCVGLVYNGTEWNLI